MCLDFGCVETVEFAIEQRVERRFAFGATGHLLPSFPSRDRNSVASMTRARASLDITVPIGTSVIAAISRYDRESSSRRLMASRKGSGITPIASRTHRSDEGPVGKGGVN